MVMAQNSVAVLEKGRSMVFRAVREFGLFSRTPRERVECARKSDRAQGKG